MAKEVDYLAEWFTRYMKNRDLAFRRIKDIKTKDHLITISENSGRKIVYHVVPFIDDFKTHIPNLKGDNVGIITFNTPEAFDSLIKSWKELIKIPSLVIYFFSPFSKTEKRWIIRPKTHNMVSDEETLKDGLKSMYMTVDPVNKKEIQKIIG